MRASLRCLAVRMSIGQTLQAAVPINPGWCCRHVLAQATERTLVLVDELGKGTEPKDGTAMLGAIVHALHQRSARGIFAT